MSGEPAASQNTAFPGPVTEFSRLRIKNGASDDEEHTITQVMARAKKGMEDFTGNPFYILEGIDDRSHLFIIGQWESLEQHMNDWVPSSQNQSLVSDLTDLVTLDWLFHIAAPLSALPISQLLETRAELFAELTNGTESTPMVFNCGRHAKTSSSSRNQINPHLQAYRAAGEASASGYQAFVSKSLPEVV